MLNLKSNIEMKEGAGRHFHQFYPYLHMWWALPYGIFASSLADFSDICSREAVCVLDEQVELHIVSNWGLSECSREDGLPAGLVWQRDVDQLVQSPRSQQCRVNDVWPVGTIGGVSFKSGSP